MSVQATVSAVRVFPVKSMAGEPVTGIDIVHSGVRHDRGHAVVDADQAVITAAQAPLLREVVAGVDQSSGAVWVEIRDTGVRHAGAEADEALSRLLGRAVRLVAVDAAGQLEAPVHLVSRQAVDAALRGEHEAADCACSLEQPRANLELDLVDPAGRLENDWVGQTVTVGEAVLELRRRPGHCLGVYAHVLRPGRVRVADAVSLDPAIL